MIDHTYELPVMRPARLLGISRSSLFYQPCPVSKADLDMKCQVDAIYLDSPFASSRMLRDLLRGECIKIARGAVRTMRKPTGI